MLKQRTSLHRSLYLLVCFATISGTTVKAVRANSVKNLSQICYATQANNTESKNSFSGNVSWYGPGFNGKKTASGEIFDMNKLTAAHLTLRLGTKVLIEDPKTGRSVIVKVNDRGPYVKTRVMDLSKEGGRRMDLLTRGVAYVNCLIIN